MLIRGPCARRVGSTSTNKYNDKTDRLLAYGCAGGETGTNREGNRVGATTKYCVRAVEDCEDDVEADEDEEAENGTHDNDEDLDALLFLGVDSVTLFKPLSPSPPL